MTSTDAPLASTAVLIVEDEAFVAMALEEAFAKAGAKVIGPAATLAEATELSASEEMDAAVLDIDLAGLDVFPVADMLKERGVPFLFQTGHGQRRELAADYPEVRVHKKPVRPKELVRIVAEMLGRG